MSEVAVVVPIHDAAAHLPRLLDRLRDEHARQPFTLVLSDNGSSDGSWKMIQDFASSVDFAIATRSGSPRCAAHARNEGVRATGAELLLFCDADDVPAQGWAAAMVAALADAPYVGGAKEYGALNAPVLLRVRPLALQADGGGGRMSGCNFGCQRWLWEQLGGQDVSMPPGSEDTDFTARVKRDLGIEPTFVPDAVVHYRLREGVWGNYRQARTRGRSEVAIYAKYGSRPLARRSMAMLQRMGRVARAAAGAPFGEAGRLRLAWQLGMAVGRIQGSVRYRVLYV